MKVGTIVYLKSGSPPLTVTNIDNTMNNGKITVQWFEDDKIQTWVISPDCLTEEIPPKAE